jgi:hypothetical protein
MLGSCRVFLFPVWEVKTFIGDRVKFSIENVFLPDPEQTLKTLSLESEVEGTIVGFSDSGNRPRAFAVVDVVRRKTVVVPVDKVRLERDENPNGKDLE